VRGEKDCRSGWIGRWLRAVFSSTVHLVGRHWKVRAQKMQFPLATAPSAGPIRVGRASKAERLPCSSGRKIGTGDRLVRRTSIAWYAAANREYTSPWLAPSSRETRFPPAGLGPHRVRPSVPRLRGGWHAAGRDASGATSPNARGRHCRASDCSPERPGRHESEPSSTARLAARRTLVHCSTRSGQVDRRRGRSDEERTLALECEPGEIQRGRRIPHHRPQVLAWQPVGRFQDRD